VPTYTDANGVPTGGVWHFKVLQAKSDAGIDGYRAYWFDPRLKDEPNSRSTRLVETCPWSRNKSGVATSMHTLFADVWEWGVQRPGGE
jgi:hypothetical protein